MERQGGDRVGGIDGEGDRGKGKGGYMRRDK